MLKAMAGNGRTKNVLPEPFKDSVMKKYEYHDYDEKAGDWIPAPFGNFHVKRPHATFLVPMVFNKDCDPFPVLEEKQIEEGDYLLITTPKTGTHVTHEIMKMLKNGKAVYNAGNKSEEWIDVCPYDKVCKTVTKPRVLCSHVSPTCLPKSFRRSDTKVVMTLRNLKDTMVSFFHHFIGMKPTNSGTEPGTKEEWSVYFKYLLHSDEVAFGNFFNTFADIWDNYRSDPNVLIVFFEDIKRQPMNVVEKIAKHMGVVHSQQLINEIVVAININKMKAGKHASEAEYRQMFGGDFSLYRKGEIGEWKQWFSDAQNAEFHKKFDAWNKQRQIPMVFE